MNRLKKFLKTHLYLFLYFIISISLLLLFIATPGVVKSIFLSFLVSWISSGMFYLILIWIPDKQKKENIKNHLKECNRSFKRKCIMTFLFCEKGSVSSADNIEGLLNLRTFREYFNSSQSINTSRWDKVLDGIEDNKAYWSDIQQELEILKSEVDYALNHLPISNRKGLFARFKHISDFIYRFKTASFNDYSDSKWIERELWQWFSGYSIDTGNYRDTDILEELINNI